MASFTRLTFGSRAGAYINLDLVRAVTPIGSGGCLVHFDQNDTIAIHESTDAIAKAAANLQQRER